MKILVFGFSENPDRYSYLAANLLIESKYDTVKFNPRMDNPKLLDENFDTVTMYVSETISNKFQDLLLELNFKRIIFNPGSENTQLELILQARGIEVLHACTLVLLRTGQF